ERGPVLASSWLVERRKAPGWVVKAPGRVQVQRDRLGVDPECRLMSKDGTPERIGADLPHTTSNPQRGRGNARRGIQALLGQSGRQYGVFLSRRALHARVGRGSGAAEIRLKFFH